MNPQNFTRMDLSRRLIRVARPVLFPLVFSLLARIVALVLGIALFAVGTWALGSYASDPASVTLSWVVWALVIMSLLNCLKKLQKMPSPLNLRQRSGLFWKRMAFFCERLG